MKHLIAETTHRWLIIVGRYVIERALGSGGMSSIHLARDIRVGNKALVIKD